MSSAALIALRAKYYALLSAVSSASSQLAKANSTILTTIENLKLDFLYDDKSAENSVTKNRYDETQNIITTLNNSVIPAIKARIEQLNREIEAALRREAEERRKARGGK